MGIARRETCPACGARARRTLLKRTFSDLRLVAFAERHYPRLRPGRFEEATRGATYELVRCGECGLVYQVGVPEGELLHEIYDVWCDAEASRAKNVRKLAGGRAGKLIQDAMLLAEVAGGKPPLRVLDYGAGWGAWCEAARALGFDAHAHELGRDRIEGLRARGIPVVEDAGLGHADFDAINAEQVFEHLTDPLDVATRLAGSLRPGGALRISVPSGSFLGPALWREDWSAGRSSPASLNAVIPLEHINAFTPRSLTALARRAGLTPVPLGIAADYRHVVASGSLAKALLRPIYFRAIGRNLTMFFRA